MPRIIPVLLGAGCICLSGCGTYSDAMCGPIDDNTYYRGVRLDVQAAKEGGAKVLMLADIPFSAVADTVLIPYYARLRRESEANLRSRSAAGVPAKADNLDPVQPASGHDPE